MRFIRHFGDRTLVNWDPSTFRDEFLTVTASNRLFTERSGNTSTQVDAGLAAIDPSGKLQATSEKVGLCHTSENRVEYFASKRKDNKQM